MALVHATHYGLGPRDSCSSARRAGSIRVKASTLNPEVPTHVIPSSIVPLGMDVSLHPSQQGKNALVTGCARGIGFNTARLLAALGATVYMADVDIATLKNSAERIREQVPGAHVVVTPRLDLGSQSAVHSWGDQWLAGRCGNTLPTTLDILVNNAGANFMGVEPWTTDQSVAGLPQVNFLGPYTLTRRLLPSLRSAAQPRIVNVASVMHRFSELPSDPEFFLKDWWKGGAYRNCKHANVVFTILMQQAALKSPGLSNLTAVAVDPGAVYSNIWAASRVFGKPPGSHIIRTIFSTPEDACATSVHAAVGTDVRGGQYWARGLFASDVIVKSSWEPGAGVFSCVDWPLRNMSSGQMASNIAAVEIAPKARAAVTDGRGVALWDAAAKLAGMSDWSRGLDA